MRRVFEATRYGGISGLTFCEDHADNFEMPVALEDLTPASIVTGLVPNTEATVVQSRWHGPNALTLRSGRLTVR